jgi:hypothetical protein
MLMLMLMLMLIDARTHSAILKDQHKKRPTHTGCDAPREPNSTRNPTTPNRHLHTPGHPEAVL